MPKRKKSAGEAAPAKPQAAPPAQKKLDPVTMAAWALVAVLLGTNAVSYLSRQDALARAQRAADNASRAATPPQADPNAPAPPAEPASEGSDYRGKFKIVNAHDHLYREQDLQKYLDAADAMDVASTLFVGSSDFTIRGKGGDPKKMNAENSHIVAECAQKFPGKIIPFCTLHPDDPDKEQLLADYEKMGVRGLKLYTGHTNLYDRPLNVPEMEPVYAYCEKNSFPILWHVSLNTYYKEFMAVLEAHPKLKLIIPHYGVAFFQPGGPKWTQLEDLLDKYPNIYVDCSYGTREILVMGLQSIDRKPEIFKAFYEKYQDRIVWGTDMVVTGNEEKSQEWIESVIRACRDVLEKPVYTFWMAAKGCKYAGKNNNNPYGKLRGLALPPEILKKVYETNIEHFLAIKTN